MSGRGPRLRAQLNRPEHARPRLGAGGARSGSPGGETRAMGRAGAVPPWEWWNGRGVRATVWADGNRRSHPFHAPYWRGVAATSEKEGVAFKSAAVAEAVGYRMAGECW